MSDEVTILSDETLLEICRVSQEESDATPEMLDELRFAQRLLPPPQSRHDGRLTNAITLLASVLGRISKYNLTHLPLGYEGPTVTSSGWLDRNDLEMVAKQIVGLTWTDVKPDEVRSFVGQAISKAVNLGLIEEQEYDAWRPGMKSGSGWRAAVSATTYGVAKARVLSERQGDMGSKPTDGNTSVRRSPLTEPAVSAPKIDDRAMPRYFLTVRNPLLALGDEGSVDRFDDPKATHEIDARVFYQTDSEVVAQKLVELLRHEESSQEEWAALFEVVDAANLDFAQRVFFWQAIEVLEKIEAVGDWDPGVWADNGLPHDKSTVFLMQSRYKAQQWERLVREELGVEENVGNPDDGLAPFDLPEVDEYRRMSPLNLATIIENWEEALIAISQVIKKGDKNEICDLIRNYCIERISNFIRLAMEDRGISSAPFARVCELFYSAGTGLDVKTDDGWLDGALSSLARLKSKLALEATEVKVPANPEKVQGPAPDRLQQLRQTFESAVRRLEAIPETELSPSGRPFIKECADAMLAFSAWFGEQTPDDVAIDGNAYRVNYALGGLSGVIDWIALHWSVPFAKEIDQDTAELVKEAEAFDKAVVRAHKVASKPNELRLERRPLSDLTYTDFEERIGLISSLAFRLGDRLQRVAVWASDDHPPARPKARLRPESTSKQLSTTDDEVGAEQAKEPSNGTGAATVDGKWEFEDLPDGEVRARNHRLCETYSRLNLGDLLLLCHQWRQTAVRFTAATKRAGKYHERVVHDEKIKEVTKILETAMVSRQMDGANRLSRCLRRPDDDHLHHALAALDVLEAKLRAETCASGELETVNMVGEEAALSDPQSQQSKTPKSLAPSTGPVIIDLPAAQCYGEVDTEAGRSVLRIFRRKLGPGKRAEICDPIALTNQNYKILATGIDWARTRYIENKFEQIKGNGRPVDRSECEPPDEYTHEVEFTRDQLARIVCNKEKFSDLKSPERKRIKPAIGRVRDLAKFLQDDCKLILCADKDRAWVRRVAIRLRLRKSGKA